VKGSCTLLLEKASIRHIRRERPNEGRE